MVFYQWIVFNRTYFQLSKLEISAGFNLKNNVYTVTKREGVFLNAAFAMSVSLTN
jgi:hypothetical protein